MIDTLIGGIHLSNWQVLVGFNAIFDNFVVAYFLGPPCIFDRNCICVGLWVVTNPCAIFSEKQH